MDERDVEPGNGLHEDQCWMRPLLRGTLLGTVPWRARSSVRERLRPDTQAAAIGTTAPVEKIEDDLRQFHERPVP